MGKYRLYIHHFQNGFVCGLNIIPSSSFKAARKKMIKYANEYIEKCFLLCEVDDRIIRLENKMVKENVDLFINF